VLVGIVATGVLLITALMAGLRLRCRSRQRRRQAAEAPAPPSRAESTPSPFKMAKSPVKIASHYVELNTKDPDLLPDQGAFSRRRRHCQWTRHLLHNIKFP